MGFGNGSTHQRKCCLWSFRTDCLGDVGGAKRCKAKALDMQMNPVKDVLWPERERNDGEGDSNGEGSDGEEEEEEE